MNIGLLQSGILDLMALTLNFVVLAMTMRIRAEIAELKVYMHENFELKRKIQR